MPSPTGYWSNEEAKDNHDFSYQLARWIADFLPKHQVVIDMGCGKGEYLRYLHDRGFEQLLGLEGDPPENRDFGNIERQDLTESFHESNPGNTICLEVGEHIPEEYLRQFLDNVANNTSNCLIISWAIPDQDGYGHVSNRHNVWVINELQDRGLDFMPQLSLDARSVIEQRVSYFRNTIMIFIKKTI